MKLMISGNKQAELYELATETIPEAWGKTLVVAPHPDDESLGCGGTIARLRQAGVPVEVAFVSDGSMSHPNSKKYPAERRILLREQEALNALQIIGVNKEAVHFMRLKDSQLPAKGTPFFAEAAEQFKQLLSSANPFTVLVPWRRDPHPDHRATWQIVHAAMHGCSPPVRLLEYLIWLWERGNENEFPQKDEARLLKVNVEPVALQKKQAIMAHTSQVTRLIDDDPEGFILSPEVLAHFAGKYELFAEII